MTQDKRQSIYIGIDLGTTALKAAAFCAGDHAVVARAEERLPVRVGTDGAREQDLLLLKDALCAVIADLRAQLGAQVAHLEGIGLAAQGGSGALLHRGSGEPHTPLMLWSDSRPRAIYQDIASARPAEYWQALSHTAFPGAGLAKLRWYRSMSPALFGAETIYAGAGEYAYFLLTGLWRQDACNARQIGCYHVWEDRLVAEPLDLAAGVSVSFVAPLRRGHEIHPLSAAGAHLLGLPAGVPVAGPYMDHEAGFMSAQHISPHPLQSSLGTAWVGNFVVPTPTSGSSPTQLIIPAPAGSGQLVIQPLLTGNVTWEWALRTFLHADIAVALASADLLFRQEMLPPDGMVGLPWFTQANPLWPEADGAGLFYGLSSGVETAAFVRAIAVGLSCEFHRMFADVAGSGTVDSLVLGGGASKGWFFRQLLAALFHPLPVYSLQDEALAGARGAIYAFAQQSAQAHPLPVALPQPELCERISRYSSRYLALYERIYGHIAIGAPYTLTL